MKNKNLWRKVSSSSLAFFLALIIFIIGLTVGFRIGVFGNATIEKAIIESNYYEKSYQVLENQIHWILSDTDFEDNVILSELSLDQFYIDARSQTQRILRGSDSDQFTKQVAEFNQKVLENLRKEYENRNLTLTQEQQTKLEEVSEQVMQLYQKQVEFGLIKEIISYRERFESYSIPVVIGLLVLGSLTVGLLLKMYRHKHKAIRYMVHSMISASGLLLLTALFFLKNLDYATIVSTKEHYQRFLEVYSKESEIALLYPAGCMMILSCLLLVLIKELRKRAIGV